MSDNVIKRENVEVHKYDGGTNIQIRSDNGRAVSVCRTDSGLWDVKTDKGDYPYTGTDGKAAAEAVKRYLED